ncbi:MAG: undecaprenyl-phosphate glucose phosphotransferase [Syntrophaceae bacterium]|nr:undecaprenyl-phosphate glucose phosphotransferase [Syntrophaceae bacterium]
MLKKHSQFVLSLFFVLELALLALCWLLSYYVRFHLQPFFPAGAPVPVTVYLWALLPLLLTWSVVSRILKLYQPRRIGSGTREIKGIVGALTGTLMILVCFLYATKQFEFSRLGYLFFWVAGITALSLERTMVRKSLKSIRKRGYNQRFALIIGSGSLVDKLLDSIFHHPELGIAVTGILSPKPEGENESKRGIPVIGEIDQLEEVIGRGGWDIVFVALPIEAHHHLGPILNILRGRMLDIKIIPDVYEYTALRDGLDSLDDIPLVSLQTSPLFGWNRISKKCFDVGIALLSLTLFAPLFLLIALAIRMTSPGPVFYVQDRMGMDGKIFRIYKFRTMEANAEEESRPIWPRREDHRRTRVGAFLRAANLDELPQLFNVLKGDMSIVGPRPERPFFVERFARHFPQYMLRHRIKSGMTGWAQVNGFRGNTSLEKRIECDLFYIKNWSLGLDVKILLMTLWRGFKNAC